MASKAEIAVAMAARKDIVPLTRADVLGGVQRVHMNDRHRPDGTCYEWRSNGRVQTWKTRPNDFRWPVKYGMYEYGSIDSYDVKDYHRADTCPVDRALREYWAQGRLPLGKFRAKGLVAEAARRSRDARHQARRKDGRFA